MTPERTLADQIPEPDEEEVFNKMINAWQFNPG